MARPKKHTLRTPPRDRVPSYIIPSANLVRLMQQNAKADGDTVTLNEDGQFSAPTLTKMYVSRFIADNRLITQGA